MKKPPRKYKPRKAIRPAPPPGQDVERERLYGEFEDPHGGIYFCFKSPRHNPFAKHHWARYMTIGRLTDDQLKRIHTLEIAHGRPLVGFEIQRECLVPPMKVIDQRTIDAVTEWLIENMVDEVDHRCVEIEVKDAVAAMAQVVRDNVRGVDDQRLQHMVAARAWWRTHPHLLRQLGMFHSTDWAFRKADIHVAATATRRPAQVETVDVAEDQQATMWQS